MTREELKRIFTETDYPHTGGTAEELRVAEFLKARCEALGVAARLEPFRVPMAEVKGGSVTADGREIPCEPLALCGSGEAEGPLCYLPALDPVSVAGAAGKIVLLDTQGVGRYGYEDLVKAGARGILFQYGNLHYPQRDIDRRELREHVVNGQPKLLCAMIHAESAVELVRNPPASVRIAVDQEEADGESRNVVAEIPGRRPEFITLTAHYDSTALSHGAYDNMTGCAGLLGVMDALKDRPLNYGLRFVFCGSEERGLLGSKAYAEAHAEELEQTAQNIDLDMLGPVMGKFIARVSAEDKLAHYLAYMGAELGFPVAAKVGVYSSDSTPFADKGVPAVSLARIASGNVAPIHCRYDRMDVLSMEQLEKDTAFIAEFTRRMAEAVCCPVAREIPESVKKELDEYLFRKRKED